MVQNLYLIDKYFPSATTGYAYNVNLLINFFFYA
jgi:hypothetical protein